MIFTTNVVDWQQSVLDNSHSVSNHVWKHTMVMLDLLAKSEISGTFFIQKNVALKYPVLVRKILAAGHEVGCYLDTPYNSQTFQQKAQYAIQNMQDICGEQVLGVRSKELSLLNTNFDHYCNVLKDNGIKYDSSLVTSRSVSELENQHPSLGAFKAYDIWQHTLPSLFSTTSRFATFKKIGEFGGSGFRLLPYDVSLFIARQFDRDTTVFQLPIYDLGINEYEALKSSFQLPLSHRFEFYGRKSVAEKLQKLFADFPFTNFSEFHAATGEIS